MAISREEFKRVKQFFQALEDLPLVAGDDRYVPIPQELGGDAIQTLREVISLSSSSSVQLLFGQRGNGKSTELLRLKGMLEKDGYEVFLCDMRNYLNLTQPLEVGDFLISLMGGLSDEFKDRFGQDPSKQSYWDKAAAFLNTVVKFESFGVKLSGAELKASLVMDPDFKERLQEKLRGHVARIREDAWKFASEVVNLVRHERQDPGKEVVLLVDSVEQIRGVGVEGSKQVHASMENLFSVHAAALQIPWLHAVYTIPPYLPPLVPNLSTCLGGGQLFRLSSIRVKNRDGKENEAGLAFMAHIVAERFSQWDTVFSASQVRQLALSSGGDLRNFFRLLRNSMALANTGTGLPLTDAIVRRAEQNLLSEMLPLAKWDARQLYRIMTSKKSEMADIGDLPVLARYFDHQRVLNYRNGEDWYDVNPLLQNEVRALGAPDEVEPQEPAGSGNG